MAALATAGRLFIRYRQFGKFQIDDIFNGLALFTLFAYATVSDVYTWSDSYDDAVYLR